jgi:5'-3' exonuclease
MVAAARAADIAAGYESIALVDLSYLFKKNWHGTPRDAAPGEAAQATLDQLAGVRESVAHVIVCCDAPPYRRKDIDPEYKAQRERPEDAELSQKRWLMDRIGKGGYQIAKAKGYEADDVIASLAVAYAWCPDVRIIGCDKDCAQCVTETVRMFVPSVGERPGEIRGPAEVMTKFGVAPKDMALWLALVGDTADNVKGVPGVGPKKAAQLIADCGSLAGIAEALAIGDEGGKPSAMWRALALHWDQLAVALSLTTLDTAAPVDAAALLGKRRPARLVADEAFDADDPPPNPPANPPAHPKETMTQAYTNANDTTPDPAEAKPQPAPAAKPKATDAEWEPKTGPGLKSTTVGSAIALVGAKPPEDFGAVDLDLQPQDLKSARNIARWIYNGQLYPQFPTPESVFTIIMRGKELGVGVTTSLAGFHLIEGKPCASADLIRSLAERHPDCEYFRLVESAPETATWETKHRSHPEPTRYTYTLDEAKQADLVRPSRNGKPSPWMTRPRDMVCKTAGSKLARIVYPGATIGLYAPEEMDAA